MASIETTQLRLEVKEFIDLSHWGWTLTDDTGAFLADHEIRLDPSAERFEAFTSLWDYISWHAAPDKRLPEEARIVTDLGDWTGKHVFGDTIGSALVERGPATVEVILPAGAEALAHLPLELARIQSRSLAGHGITLVMRPQTTHDPHSKAAVGDRLRVLGLFSLPEGGSALNLRRERQSLVQLIRSIADNGRAADIRVLQYGVTRERLRGVLEEAEGWDVIHLSGHGTPGELMLETAAGTPDPISAGDLADLLYSARDRVKLITLSACWSAALTAAEQRRMLGLPVEGDQNNDPERPEQSPSRETSVPGTLATMLSSRLGCAVLAMRFPIDDEFAIALAGQLYDLLAGEGEPLPRAVALTLSHLTYGADARRFPALSIAAPAIFGATAATLTLKAPQRTGQVTEPAENLKMAGFPPQPKRFVGRAAVMTRASSTLAADTGVPGVLLHGMPGGGKTACALELAYTHEYAFDRLIWFKARDEGMAIEGALTDFALTMERDLPDFQMVHVLANAAELDAFLPKLTQLIEQSRLLVVIDNAESFLTDTGQWRDERWGKVFGALTGHNGLGRLIVTSLRVPAEATNATVQSVSAKTRAVQVEVVDALSLDEALLLTRELPNLRRLTYGELSGIDPGTSRQLAVGLLATAQGHPKLLELADGQAARPEGVAALTEAGDQAWRDQGGLPGGFFTTGETAAAPGDYLHVLDAWTKSATDTLSPSERDLFWLLSCLEESDRLRPIVESIWPYLWDRLGREGQLPALDQNFVAIAACGLASSRARTSRSSESYTIHSGVATAAREHAGQLFRNAADTEAAFYWDAVYAQVYERNSDGTVGDTRVMVYAGLAAVPYLIRSEQWNRAATMLDNAFIRDPSQANAAAVLPAIQQIARHEPRVTGVLARILQVLDPANAETQMRVALGDAVARGDYHAASVTAGWLSDLCRDGGRLDEALDVADQMIGYTRQAGLGPWTQLSDEIQRLRVLNEMGHVSHVRTEVLRLGSHINTLPATPDPDEAVPPSNVIEGLLSLGFTAARTLGRHDEALALNTARIASMRGRRASAAEIASTRFNEYGLLLRLGRTDQALDLLLHCRQAFHDAHDIQMLGKTLGALAEVESERGHGDAAIRLGRDALRYAYQVGEVDEIANSYQHFGTYLRRHARQSAAFASHITAALIYALTGIGGPAVVAASIRSAAIDLCEFGSEPGPLANIADLCRRISDIPGTAPARLIARLSPDPETAEHALRDFIVLARRAAKIQADDTNHS